MSKKTIDSPASDRKMRRIIPDEDPLSWAKAICERRQETREQAEAIADVRDATIVLIVSIISRCSPSTDRTTAIRKAREAMMFASAAVALDWEIL